MGNENQIKFYEAELLLSKQRKKFFCIIGLVSLVGIAFLISTTILALRVKRGYPSAVVEYHVWDDHEPKNGNQHFLQLKVPDNATVYTAMEHAAASANHFRYDIKQYEFGKYIQAIGGVRENLQESRFWMLYKLTETPNENNPPTVEAVEQGIDDLRVQDGDIYLFWLTKLDLNSPVRKNHMKSLGRLSPPCVKGMLF